MFKELPRWLYLLLAFLAIGAAVMKFALVGRVTWAPHGSNAAAYIDGAELFFILAGFGTYMRKPDGPGGPGVLRALLPVALLLGIAGCGMPPELVAKQQVSNGNAMLGAGYRGVKLHAQQEGKKIDAAIAARNPTLAEQLTDKLEALAKKLFQALDVGADLVSAADDALDTAIAAKSGNYIAAVEPAQRAVLDVIKAFADAGVKLPAAAKGGK